jgi:hypothetical protein
MQSWGFFIPWTRRKGAADLVTAAPSLGFCPAKHEGLGDGMAGRYGDVSAREVVPVIAGNRCPVAQPGRGFFR